MLLYRIVQTFPKENQISRSGVGLIECIVEAGAESIFPYSQGYPFGHWLDL